MFRIRPLTVLVFLLVLSGCAAGGAWDPLARAPDPPELPNGDARDPGAWYAYGERLLSDAPMKAADAFHMASRLDPGWAEPLYARRLALLASDPYIFGQYLEGSRRIRATPGVRRVDSLFLRALRLNPFLHRRAEGEAVRFLLREQIRDRLNRDMRVVDEATVRMAIDDYLANDASVGIRAGLAYSDGRYGDAEVLYRRLLDRYPESSYYLAELGRTLFQLGQFFEAGDYLARASDVLSRADEDRLVAVYESSAIYDHSVGMAQEALGRKDGARASYAAALREDLSYHPAHVRLAALALEEGDTATALSEMALAAQIAPADPVVRYRHGRLLAEAGRHEDAVPELRAAIELAPLYAAPHRDLALSLEALGREADAMTEHRRFLEEAAPGMPGVTPSRERVDAAEALGGA